MGPKTKQLSRGDWLAAAMNALEVHGIQGVRVQTIAKKLGVTTGSFYWHFENRRELLAAMLDYWDGSMTDSVIVDVEAAGCAPKERILTLMEVVVLKKRNRYDTAFRSWARSDPAVAERVRGVDARRHRFVEGLFRTVGFTKSEARARGRLLADYLMAQGVVLDQYPERELKRLLRAQWKVLVGE